MNNFMFNVKQLKMKKCIWQLIISTSNATLEVPSLRPFSFLIKLQAGNLELSEIAIGNVL